MRGENDAIQDGKIIFNCDKMSDAAKEDKDANERDALYKPEERPNLDDKKSQKEEDKAKEQTKSKFPLPTLLFGIIALIIFALIFLVGNKSFISKFFLAIIIGLTAAAGLSVIHREWQRGNDSSAWVAAVLILLFMGLLLWLI